MRVQWNTDGTVSIEPPKRPKKLTGTRLAGVLGLNRWTTPFQIWCEVTKTWQKPFDDTKYTLAGKAVEPKQIAYMREAYGMDDLIDPHDVWGADPFSKTYGNFYRHPVLGGMWDALLVDKDRWDGSADGLRGCTDAVLEFKTTKRAEDWADGAIPEYYAMQAALYAWLLGCDDVIMVVSFLQEGDYDRPEEFAPSAANTATREFKVSERYPSFERDVVGKALAWWELHVETGDSPEYDERRDAEPLKALRTETLNPESDVEALLSELSDLNAKVSAAHAAVAESEKRMKVVKDQLKQYALERIGDSEACELSGGGVTCKLVRTVSDKVDEKAMKADGVYEKYLVKSESSRFTVTFAKE